MQQPDAEARKFSRAPDELKVVLFEGIHDTAVETLEAGGFSRIERHAKALSGQALLDAGADKGLVDEDGSAPFELTEDEALRSILRL